MFVFTYQITWNFTNRFWRTGKESTRQQTFRLIENSLFGTVKVLNSYEELLSDDTKMKRGISNEQICILSLVDRPFPIDTKGFF